MAGATARPDTACPPESRVFGTLTGMAADAGGTGETTPDDWFQDWYEEPADLPFVVHLRRLAAERLTGLIDPCATDHLQPGNELDFGGSLLLVDVIDGTTRRRLNPGSSWILQLQVLWNGSAVQGYWGDGFFWDGFHPDYDEILNIEDPSMTDLAAAERTVEWLQEQLSRPLELRQWDRPDGKPAFELWLTDIGGRIPSRGWPWQRRGAPTTVTRVRPPGSTPSQGR